MSDRQDRGSFDPSYRPDKDGGTQDLKSSVVVPVVTDKTEWLLFDEITAPGSKGEGDLTGIGEGSYPGTHQETGSGSSGTGVKG